MVARQWLCERTWHAALPFQWIDLFLYRLDSEAAEIQSAGESQNSHRDNSTRGSDSHTQDSDDDPVREALPMAERIPRAAEWAAKEANIPESSLWYERLGWTYLKYDEILLSEKAFLKAREMRDSSWRISEGLAQVYSANGELKEAIQELELLFTHTREIEALTSDERVTYVESLYDAAVWNEDLGNISEATNKLREALRVDEHHYRSYYLLLRILMDTDQKSEALELLEHVKMHPANHNLTQLQTLLLEFPGWGSPLMYFETVLRVAGGHSLFHAILDALENALEYARKNKLTDTVIDLLLCQGVAHGRHSASQQTLETALGKWTECYNLCCKSGSSEGWDSALAAATYIFDHYFTKARLTEFAAAEFDTYEPVLKEMVENTSSAAGTPALRIRLASFYTFARNREAARKLLLNDLILAMDLLSDDDPENDYIGYLRMLDIFIHTGDDLDALSAQALRGPDKVAPELDSSLDGADDSDPKNQDKELHGDLSPVDKEPVEMLCFRCLGDCERSFTSRDSIWWCKICVDTGFDGDCLAKVRNGTLKTSICSPDHEWLCFSSLVDEFRVTAQGSVRVGGELQDGKRIGGEIVTIEAWLDSIREQ